MKFLAELGRLIISRIFVIINGIDNIFFSGRTVALNDFSWVANYNRVVGDVKIDKSMITVNIFFIIGIIYSVLFDENSCKQTLVQNISRLVQWQISDNTMVAQSSCSQCALHAFRCVVLSSCVVLWR